MSILGKRILLSTIGIELRLKRKREYIYFTWDNEGGTLFTHPEIIKLHRNIYHSHSTNLYNLPKLAKTKETNTETEQILEKIQTRVDTSRNISHAPLSFKTFRPITENIQFD